MLAVSIALGWCGAADAAGRPGEDNWVESRSLRELPAGIQVLLGVGLPPMSDAMRNDGIADSGQPFNSGDVIAQALPMRRFAFGLVDGDTALVAVERGGRAYWVQTVEFKRRAELWEVVRCARSGTVPRRAAELRAVFMVQAAFGTESCDLPGLPGAAAAVAGAAQRLRPRPGA
jgi:hypothetical protein